MTSSEHRFAGLSESGLSTLASAVARRRCRVELNRRIVGRAALVLERATIAIHPDRCRVEDVFFLATLLPLHQDAGCTRWRSSLAGAAIQLLRKRFSRFPIDGVTIAKPRRGDVRISERDLRIEKLETVDAGHDWSHGLRLSDYRVDTIRGDLELFLRELESGQVEARHVPGFPDVPYVEVPIHLPEGLVSEEHHETAQTVLERSRAAVADFKRCLQQKNEGNFDEELRFRHAHEGDELDPDLLHEAWAARYTNEDPPVFLSREDPPVSTFDPERFAFVSAIDCAQVTRESDTELGVRWLQLAFGQALAELGVTFSMIGFFDRWVPRGDSGLLLHLPVVIKQARQPWDEEALTRLAWLVSQPQLDFGIPASFPPLHFRALRKQLTAMRDIAEFKQWCMMAIGSEERLFDTADPTLAGRCADEVARIVEETKNELEGLWDGILMLPSAVASRLPSGSTAADWSLGIVPEGRPTRS